MANAILSATHNEFAKFNVRRGLIFNDVLGTVFFRFFSVFIAAHRVNFFTKRKICCQRRLSTMVMGGF